jgi:hypothetical protein
MFGLALPLAYLVRNLPISSRSILAGFARSILRWTRPRPLWAREGGGPVAGDASIVAADARPVRPRFVTGLGDFVTSVVLYT